MFVADRLPTDSSRELESLLNFTFYVANLTPSVSKCVCIPTHEHQGNINVYTLMNR